MYLKGLLRDIVLEMRALDMAHNIRLKQADKDGVAVFDPITIAPWHKYLGLREFAADYFQVAERRIEKIVANKNIRIRNEEDLILKLVQQRF